MTNFDFVQKYEIRIFHFIDTLTPSWRRENAQTGVVYTRTKTVSRLSLELKIIYVFSLFCMMNYFVCVVVDICRSGSWDIFSVVFFSNKSARSTHIQISQVVLTGLSPEQCLNNINVIMREQHCWTNNVVEHMCFNIVEQRWSDMVVHACCWKQGKLFVLIEQPCSLSLTCLFQLVNKLLQQCSNNIVIMAEQNCWQPCPCSWPVQRCSCWPAQQCSS